MPGRRPSRSSMRCIAALLRAPRMRDRRRVIVIGPQFGGGDGLSELGRQVVAALAADTADTIVAYSLQDRGHPELLRRMPVEFCSSDGNRLRFVAPILGVTLPG